jgi:hypothetical protein
MHYLHRHVLFFYQQAWTTLHLHSEDFMDAEDDDNAPRDCSHLSDADNADAEEKAAADIDSWCSVQLGSKAGRVWWATKSAAGSWRTLRSLTALTNPRTAATSVSRRVKHPPVHPTLRGANGEVRPLKNVSG